MKAKFLFDYGLIEIWNLKKRSNSINDSDVDDVSIMIMNFILTPTTASNSRVIS